MLAFVLISIFFVSNSMSNWSFSPYTNRKHQRCLAPLPEAIVITAVQQQHCLLVPDDEVDDYKYNNKNSSLRKMEAEKQEAKNLVTFTTKMQKKYNLIC